MSEERDLTQLDDDALISQRADVRENLEKLSPHATQHATLVELYDRLTDEFDRRARAAWPEGSK
jgi:hypothetical protein